MELTHGGDWAGYAAQYGGMPLDFSANVSPLGLPQGVRQAVARALDGADRYPDPLCRALRKKLSGTLGVPPQSILCGNGAADLIFRLALAEKPKRALVTAPTFAEYEQALAVAGCTADRFFLREEAGFAVTEALLERIEPGLDILFLCEPNNPTGRTTPRALLLRILERCAACGTRLVVDECFNEFLENLPRTRCWESWRGMKTCCSCGRSPSGMRWRACGWATRFARTARCWSACAPPGGRGPFPLGAGGGRGRAGGNGLQRGAARLVAAERPRLSAGLAALGCRVLPGEANYLLFYHSGEQLVQRLRARGVLLRGCAVSGPGARVVPRGGAHPFGKQRLFAGAWGGVVNGALHYGAGHDVGRGQKPAGHGAVPHFSAGRPAVTPCKSQNMALNSYITRDGLEMGRAQVAQAEAAGREPDVRMNPVLLKPSSDTGSQLIVNGEVRGQYRAAEYFKMKKSLVPEILRAYESLAAENDVIVIEGAGSPAEINLRDGDIVNMGLAELVKAPVLLVGDIDRGGVFAQLYGTVALLQPEERARVVGTVINKFRGDVELLRPGLAMLEEKTGVPVLGVVPYTRADIDDEDSLAPCLAQTQQRRPLDIAVVRLPRISNFTDFSPLESHPALGVRYVERAGQLGEPDLVVLPGTKNTMGDLAWMRQNGLEAAVKKLAAAGTPVLGVCGGYQMLGTALDDPDGVEQGGRMDGMGLLPCATRFTGQKVRTRVQACAAAGPFAGAQLDGYEIHMGRTERGGTPPFCLLADGTPEGAAAGNVFGTYLHGLFDTGELTEKLAAWLLACKGLSAADVRAESHAAYKERQYDLLADAVRAAVDIAAVYRAMDACAAK